MILKKAKHLVLAVSCMVCIMSPAVHAMTYDHEITVQGMEFSWTVGGPDLHVRCTALTTGWVGIGFNPSKGMKGAKFIIGYVKDGITIIKDEFGTSEVQHQAVEKLGGESDVTLIGGKEEGGKTTIEFTIPLVSKDTIRGRIDPAGETVVLLAYGLDHDTLGLRHKFRTSITINLSTGKSD